MVDGWLVFAQSGYNATAYCESIRERYCSEERPLGQKSRIVYRHIGVWIVGSTLYLVCSV